MKCMTVTSTVFFLITLVACKKSNTPQPGPTGTPKIKTDDYAVYQYDAQGRRTEAAVNDGSKIIYTYSASIVNEKSYDNAGNFLNERIHELNASGYVQKTTYGAGNISRQTYQYNAAGQLINEHFVSGPLSDSSDRDYFYSPSGRLDSARYTRNNYSALINRQYYEYTESRPNTTSPINSGLLFMGAVRNTTPVTRTTTVYPVLPQEVGLRTYTYDAYNRINKVSYSSGGSTTYTYY